MKPELSWQKSLANASSLCVSVTFPLGLLESSAEFVAHVSLSFCYIEILSDISYLGYVEGLGGLGSWQIALVARHLAGFIDDLIAG